MRGKLIIFEGINGSGKSTIINLLFKEFKFNLNLKYLKFPDRTTKSGIIINRFLKNEISLTTDKSIELFIKNISESVQKIESLLLSGKNVICDRYTISTIVYNYTELIRNNDSEKYKSINDLLKLISNLPKPDMIFLISGNHIKERGDLIERYHIAGEIYNNYIKILNLMGGDYTIIDNKNFNDTKKNIIKISNAIITNKYPLEIIYYL